MSTSPPRVTVIIPTYNWSSVLPYSVGSALRQTFSDFEVLVVGDGCTDDSEAVVEAVQDERVRWINLPANTGHQSGPNNEGLRQARGEFIAYLGHDDLWLPHHLSCMVAALEAGADLAFGVTELIVPGGVPGKVSRLPAPATLKYVPGWWLPPTGVVHSRRVTDGVGGWGDYRTLSADPEADLLGRAYDRGYKFVFVPRLTALKFPASKRPGVYRETPHHEQAEWFERIVSEPDLEASELVALLASEVSVPVWNERPFPQFARDFLSETARRFRVRLADMVRRPRPESLRGKRVEANRRLKGLRPKL
jgi:glycosyltransferase involved in cell wall biosynthesis